MSKIRYISWLIVMGLVFSSSLTYITSVFYATRESLSVAAAVGFVIGVYFSYGHTKLEED